MTPNPTPDQETTVKALPEKSRLARNIHEGMEIWSKDDKAWLRITSALHITAPLAISRFELEDGTVVTVPPLARALSRRTEAS